MKDISVVIPVHNEQEVLPTLFKRLLPVLQGLNRPFEIILTNDGSKDASERILDEYQAQYPENIRVVHFNGNFGQHMAIMAGFEQVRGKIIITMDADLQNPPEEIPKLIALADAGHDVVGGYRLDRQDKRWRLLVSKWHNRIRAKIAPNLDMKDEGCMLRAYSRDVVDAMVNTAEKNTFIPALAMCFASNPAEVGVKHEARTEGTTSYNLYKLIRYNFDLITNFSLVPLQIFTFIGIVVSMLSTAFVGFLFVRRIMVGPEAEGVFTLFAIMFLLMGIILMGLGIVGEYIGRIYSEVRARPRFIIKRIQQENEKLKDVSNG
jgi:undecaprenyl-phosphate 4-deoxy-4-formamido-L-arabinose transferase